MGMQLRRLGARGVNLYAQRELCEDAQKREAEEELRLFHVGATRARERLLLSGVVSPSPPARKSHGDAGDRADRRRLRDRPRARLDASRSPAPEPRPASRRASALRDRGPRQPRLGRAGRGADRHAQGGRRGAGRRRGPAPLVAPPGAAGHRAGRSPTRRSPPTATAPRSGRRQRPRAARARRREPAGEDGRLPGAAPCTRCSSGATPTAGERPRAELVRASPRRPRSERDGELAEEALLAPFRAWLGSPLLRRAGPRRRAAAAPRCRCWSRSPAPSCAARSTCWSRRTGRPPLIVDYKTDRLDGAEPGRARPPLRDPAGDLRARGRRGARRRARSTSPTSSSSAPRSRSSRAGAPRRSRPAGARLEAEIARVRDD